MRAAAIMMRGLAWIIIAMLMMPPGMPAQEAGDPEQPARFSKEELVQMLAPIALYPDSLIAQILMASTYPLEVVEAERWLRQNRDLKGADLDNALLEKTWDPSVKSLCHYPDILFAMSDKLDQTRKLGDAFLGQEEDVMATIQELRRRAEEQGNLKTTKEQQVIVEKEAIRIEPADPTVIYVPVYDPYYVYGPWWYPAYPPYYWYYPPGFFYGSGYIFFGPRIFFGVGLFSWCWFDWPVRRIHIDIHKTSRFHKHRDGWRDFDKPVWKHNPGHRKGVAYRDRATSQRFGMRQPRVSPVSPEMRGYPGRRIERQDGRPSQLPVERRERTTVPDVRRVPEGSRVPAGRQEGIATPGAKAGRERIQTAPGRDTPFRGIGEGSFERRASERGGISSQRQEMRSPGGGSGRIGGGSRGSEFRSGGQSGGSRGSGRAGGGSRR
jgi:hypothetical protein